ncbi:5192_t:CDS:1, partial [Gigaspora rosea]
MNPQPISRNQNTVIHVTSTNIPLDIDQRYDDLVEGVNIFSEEQREDQIVSSQNDQFSAVLFSGS